MTLPVLPNALARRLFLHRHALGEAPTGPAKGAALAALIDRIGFVQTDPFPQETPPWVPIPLP